MISVNQVAGFPGGKVGKWENRSGTTLPNDYDTRQGTIDIGWQLTDKMRLQFLTAQTKQDARSVSDWDNSQYDLVLDENLAKTEVNSEEIQLTGGGDKIQWVGGAYYWDQTINARSLRWQVNEFQKGLMNPQNVFNNPVCNPAGAVLEATPVDDRRPEQHAVPAGHVGPHHERGLRGSER